MIAKRRMHKDNNIFSGYDILCGHCVRGVFLLGNAYTHLFIIRIFDYDTPSIRSLPIMVSYDERKQNRMKDEEE